MILVASSSAESRKQNTTLEFIGYEVPFRNENYLILIPNLPFPNPSFKRRKEDEAEEMKRVLEFYSSVRSEVLTTAISGILRHVFW
jgi:hypothetical protein